MRKLEERFRDILDAIEAIERYAINGRPAFDENELIQVWIVHHLQVIGEVVNSLLDELICKYPQVLWRQIVGFRNTIVHEYFRLSLNLVWSIVTASLPLSKVNVCQMSKDLSKEAIDE